MSDQHQTEGPVIGPYQLSGRAVLAPMAGIADAPFRRLCEQHGAALAATEMTLASHGIARTAGPGTRLDLNQTIGLKAVQIAGSDPAQVAQAAREAEALGAQIIDINMGCPAKKVCKKLAGSALLKDEALVARILEATVAAVSVPVTLKTRTGWNPDNRNGVYIAKLAESVGIASLAIHGRTRADMYKGEAEYETIRAIKQSVSIPVFANGDITSPEKARDVIKKTNVDGIMIGRGAQGRPWIFEQVNALLEEKVIVPIPSLQSRRDIICDHLDAIHHFYGEQLGVRVARKHLSWYCGDLPNSDEFRYRAVRAISAREQLQLTNNYFDRCLDASAAIYNQFPEIPDRGAGKKEKNNEKEDDPGKQGRFNQRKESATQRCH
ncbi:MAG: tRNA dihydrouridine synthase DusB [Gammaproteobacteria bacterium]|nr:tRNA dihydrouridine synthase DusB [Gammaproteobacteria bacterium]